MWVGVCVYLRVVCLEYIYVYGCDPLNFKMIYVSIKKRSSLSKYLFFTYNNKDVTEAIPFNDLMTTSSVTLSLYFSLPFQMA